MKSLVMPSGVVVFLDGGAVASLAFLLDTSAKAMARLGALEAAAVDKPVVLREAGQSPAAVPPGRNVLVASIAQVDRDGNSA